MIKKQGLWIAVEGNDGTGKTTQLKNLADYLKKQNYQVVETREPGGNPYSEEIRKLLFQNEIADDPKTQLLLFTASRRRNILKVILPALKSGAFVLSDRSELSTFAYQHSQFGLPLKEILKINNFATDLVKPDLTILLDVDVETAKKRMEKNLGDRANYFDKANLEKWEKRRRGYLMLAKKFKNILVINAKLLAKIVFQDILATLKNKNIF